MITTDFDPTTRLLTATASGDVTGKDYAATLMPALDAALAEAGGPVKMLYVLGPAFTGFSTGAMWRDAKLGLTHMRDISRVAVVTDSTTLGGMIHGLSWLLPMPVEVFATATLAEATAWVLEES